MASQRVASCTGEFRSTAIAREYEPLTGTGHLTRNRYLLIALLISVASLAACSSSENAEPTTATTAATATTSAASGSSAGSMDFIPAISTPAPLVKPQATSSAGLDAQQISIAPDFTLPSANDSPVTLSEMLEEQPVVVVFYRAFW